MKLPQSVTTVTPLSKSLALVLFIALPFIGFYFGYQYGQDTAVLDQSNINNLQLVPTNAAKSTPDLTANWPSYSSQEYQFTLNYSPSWEVSQPTDGGFATNAINTNLKPVLVLLNKTTPESCGPYACYPAIIMSKPITNKLSSSKSLEEWVKDYLIDNKVVTDKNYSFKELKPTTIGNFSAVEFNDSVFISHDDLVYPISYSAQRQNYKQEFYQILSTLNFTR
jgi:hypothetical protein